MSRFDSSVRKNGHCLCMRCSSARLSLQSSGARFTFDRRHRAGHQQSLVKGGFRASDDDIASRRSCPRTPRVLACATPGLPGVPESRFLSSIAQVKQAKRALIQQYTRPDSVKAALQVASTLVPVVALWILVVPAAETSWGWVAGITLVLTLFLIRVFVLMHECGHGSLFRTARVNNAFGFVFGVISGMPQYVWSQHHAYHHSTNGNWDKYRGPLAIVTVDEYAAMTEAQRRSYRRARSIWMAPIAGLMYLLVHPRLSWIKGSLAFGVQGTLQGSLYLQACFLMRESSLLSD